MPARTRKTTQSDDASKTVYGQREPGSLSGNLTRDPELRFTASGRAVANCGIAVNERVKNEKTGEWEDTDPEFFEITVWGRQGENLCETAVKGTRVVATGYFQDETYVNRDGEKVTTERFVATDIGPSLLFNPAKILKAQRSAK